MSRHALAALAALLPAVAGAAPAPERAADEAVGAVSVGTGSGAWLAAGRVARFDDLLPRDPLRLSIAVEGSGRLSPVFLGGLRLTSLLLAAREDGTRATLVLARLEAVATWRPLGAGPYLRAGVGPAGLRYDLRVPGLASGSLAAGGGGLSLAAGAAWPLGDRLELRLEAEGAGQAWLPSSRGPRASWTAGGALGVAWR